MRVICISGKAGHGKDTVAGLMKEALEQNDKRVLITHYGDLVKYICTTFFGWDGQKDEQGRHLLQNVGTEIVRAQDQDFWVNFVMSVLKFFNGQWDYVLIPDCRFVNEMIGPVSSGFSTTFLRVNRSGYVSTLTEEQQKHISETALDNQTHDVYIENSGDLNDLKAKVYDWVLEELGFCQSSFF